MSWLARSFVNSLRIDDDDDDDDKNFINERKTESGKDREEEQHHQIESSEPQGRGVKEDFSELTKTLTRQLWGVASFLAPPPSSEHSPPSSPSPPPRQASSTDPSISDWNRWESPDQSLYAEASDPPISDSPRIAGIRNDFAEIGGKFKTGISKLSNNKAVSEISKIASTFLTPFGSEGESDDMHSVGGAVGVTDEVLTYARNIAMHPETWLDFPLADDEDSDDFNMSDAQQEHALAVEHLTPRLTALRIELCPSHMSEGCFWKIYFVLLHSRLNKHDAELLSTPQIVEARAMLMQELQNRTKPEPDWSGRGMSYRSEARSSLQEECLSASSNTFSETIPVKTFSADHTTFIPATDFETEKHPVVSTEMRIVDKSVVEERPAIQNNKKDLLIGASSKILDQKFEPEEDGDDWLEEDNSEIGGFSGTTIPLGHDEDVSFSDLEDDDGSVPTSSKTVSYVSDSSTKESRGWVQLSRSTAESGKHDQSLDMGCLGSEQSHGNNSETKDSSDWLSVDEVDVV